MRAAALIRGCVRVRKLRGDSLHFSPRFTRWHFPQVTGPSPTGHFAYWTVRLLFGHFAYWTLRLLFGHFTCWTLRLLSGHFAYKTFACLPYKVKF